MKQSGVYFLLGRDDANQQDTVYIGQATSRKNGEGVLLRVQEHTRIIMLIISMMSLY